MTKMLLLTYDFFAVRKGRLYLLLLLAVAAFAFFASRVKYREDIAQFLPSGKRNERMHEAWKHAVSSGRIAFYVKVEKGTENAADRQVEAVDALAGRIEARMDPSKIKSLYYKVDMEEIRMVSSLVAENMPCFLDDRDYARMNALLSREFIAAQLVADRNLLTSPAGMLMRENILSDPLQMTAGLMSRLQDSGAGGRFFLYQDRLFAEDSTALLFLESKIPSSETSENETFTDSLHQIMAEVENEFPGIEISNFGTAEIAVGNARRIQRDTLLSVSLAVAVILAFLACSFRSARKIVLVFASVLFGGLFALAVMSGAYGEISIIAVGISSIMIGIAINYPLHYMEHFNHVGDHRLAIREIVRPLAIGSITTVSAFVSLMFTGSKAMRDLGLFAALLLAGTILFVLVFLPHFLSSRHIFHPSKPSFLEVLLNRLHEKNSWVITIMILLTVFFAFFSGDSRFETNMQNINYMTAAQKESYGRMNSLLNDDQHIIYFISEGLDRESALEANERNEAVLKSMLENKLITRIDGIGEFLPSQSRQEEKIRKWNDFWRGRRDSVMTFLRDEAGKTGFRRDAFEKFEEMTVRTWQAADLCRLAPALEKLAENYVIEKSDRTMIVNMLYADRDSAEVIESRLNDIGDSSLAFDSGSITKRMIASLSDNFNYVLFACGLIVFVFLLISFGRIELALITFLPLALSWIWILGIMNIFAVKFNIVNIILATFIFGQGDDYAIFMTEGLMHEHAFRRKILASYKKSIAMSALIMLAGMGMLIFARHPALRSLAQVTIIGMITVLIMSYTVPPLLFGLLTFKRGRRRQMPLTLKRLAATAYSFIIFLTVSAGLTFTGWILFSCGKKTERKKTAYHKLLYRIARGAIHHIPLVRTVLQNDPHEKFDKPAIIICNHQAHIDLMCIMMLTPKLIILTNDRVWRSPFYGRLVQYADYYPVSNGIENAMDQLKDAVRRGYSIAVFPEGTRSADCSILRFHKGAFYLAEQTGLDIIPILLHGAGHILPKDDLMLRKGCMNIRILPRITPDDVRFRKDCRHRSIDVRHYYREMYEKISKELETPGYYADLVHHNYIYKGAGIERSVRRHLGKNRNFSEIINRQPERGAIVIENTNYGEYPLLLSLVRKELQITATEPDDEIREIAENCISVPDNLKYEK
jgi:1-acyl-sn-glycerol-3-phosphate acyltransferase